MNEKSESVSVEERVRDALLARAGLVTEDSLRLPDELPEPPQRGMWPVLAAVAAVLAVVAGVAIVVAAVPLGDVEPAGPESSPAIQTPSPTSETTCPVNKQCLIQSLEVNGETLDLRGMRRDKDIGAYEDWTLTVRDGAEIARGAGKFLLYVGKDSLTCEQISGIPLCLLEASGLGDTFRVFAFSRTSSGWSYDMSFPLSLFTTQLQIGTLAAGRSPVVMSIEHDENIGRWHARVWDWDGKALGCTPYVERENDLPGFPNVTPVEKDLTDECGGYLPKINGER